jgi:hypothetical protein
MVGSYPNGRRGVRFYVRLYLRLYILYWVGFPNFSTRVAYTFTHRLESVRTVLDRRPRSPYRAVARASDGGVLHPTAADTDTSPNRVGGNSSGGHVVIRPTPYTTLTTLRPIKLVVMVREFVVA